MIHPKAQIRLFKKKDDGTWESEYSLLNITGIDVSMGIKSTKDSWSLTIPNQNGEQADTIDFDDKVQIYFYTGSDVTSSDLIMSGNVNNIETEVNNEQNQISVEGTNRTEELLNILVQLSFNKSQKDIAQVIQEIIDKVNNQKQAIEGDDDFIATDIQTTKKDGSDFPKKVFVSAYKPAYELIEKYSTDEYTKDGGYMYWVDQDNTFHWKAKTTDLNSDDYKFNEEGGKIRELKIEEGTWDVYNAAIVDVGEDANGHGNHTLVYDQVSMVENGAKWKFLDLSSTTPGLVTQEAEDHPERWTTGSDGEPTEMFPNSYPYTCSFPELDSSYETTSSNWVVDSNNQFNLALRRTARLQGKDKGKSMIEQMGEINYRIELQIDGTNQYVMGELAEITSYSHGLENQKVRIKDVTHNFSDDGWITVINCEQDPEI